MKNHLKAVATCVLITAMATAHGQTTQAGSTATGKKRVNFVEQDFPPQGSTMRSKWKRRAAARVFAQTALFSRF